MTRLLAVLTEFLFVASTSIMTEFLAIIALYCFWYIGGRVRCKKRDEREGCQPTSGLIEKGISENLNRKKNPLDEREGDSNGRRQRYGSTETLLIAVSFSINRRQWLPMNTGTSASQISGSLMWLMRSHWNEHSMLTGMRSHWNKDDAERDKESNYNHLLFFLLLYDNKRGMEYLSPLLFPSWNRRRVFSLNPGSFNQNAMIPWKT